MIIKPQNISYGTIRVRRSSTAGEDRLEALRSFNRMQIQRTRIRSSFQQVKALKEMLMELEEDMSRRQRSVRGAGGTTQVYEGSIETVMSKVAIEEGTTFGDQLDLSITRDWHGRREKEFDKFAILAGEQSAGIKKVYGLDLGGVDKAAADEAYARIEATDIEELDDLFREVKKTIEEVSEDADRRIRDRVKEALKDTLEANDLKIEDLDLSMDEAFQVLKEGASALPEGRVGVIVDPLQGPDAEEYAQKLQKWEAEAYDLDKFKVGDSSRQEVVEAVAIYEALTGGGDAFIDKRIGTARTEMSQAANEARDARLAAGDAMALAEDLKAAVEAYGVEVEIEKWEYEKGEADLHFHKTEAYDAIVVSDADKDAYEAAKKAAEAAFDQAAAAEQTARDAESQSVKARETLSNYQSLDAEGTLLASKVAEARQEVLDNTEISQQVRGEADDAMENAMDLKALVESFGVDVTVKKVEYEKGEADFDFDKTIAFDDIVLTGAIKDDYEVAKGAFKDAFEFAVAEEFRARTAEAATAESERVLARYDRLDLDGDGTGEALSTATSASAITYDGGLKARVDKKEGGGYHLTMTASLGDGVDFGTKLKDVDKNVLGFEVNNGHFEINGHTFQVDDDETFAQVLGRIDGSQAGLDVEFDRKSGEITLTKELDSLDETLRFSNDKSGVLSALGIGEATLSFGETSAPAGGGTANGQGIEFKKTRQKGKVLVRRMNGKAKGKLKGQGKAKLVKQLRKDLHKAFKGFKEVFKGGFGEGFGSLAVMDSETLAQALNVMIGEALGGEVALQVAQGEGPLNTKDLEVVMEALIDPTEEAMDGLFEDSEGGEGTVLESIITSLEGVEEDLGDRLDNRGALLAQSA